MDEMVTLDGENSIDNIANELAKNFGRYKLGEISEEECNRLNKEILERVNRQNDEKLAALKAEIEREKQ